ncbi:hypothetical protein [Lysobacter sp. A3-1-A15]|uniref:hypothetical protein n=1 Tax=Novilysobacter viscosus TaxID=3098602 RepID=UPI002ED8E91C
MTNSSDSSAGSSARSQGVASGKKTGLHQPSDDNRIEDKLGNVDLESRGIKVHDHLRNKRGKGVAGEYDDSINHDADEGYVQDNAAERPKE